MSDQTDIERIRRDRENAENALFNVAAIRTDLERENRDLRAQLALRDEETARLKEDLTFHGHRIEQARNEGFPGMPHGACSCRVCRPIYDELARLKDLESKSDQVALMLNDEIARLKAENTTFRNAQKICEDCDAPTKAEYDQLRARLAEATAEISERDRQYAKDVDTAIQTAKALGLTEEDPRTILQAAMELRDRLAECDSKLAAIESGSDVQNLSISSHFVLDCEESTNPHLARQIALESQCQRMRDALKVMKVISDAQLDGKIIDAYYIAVARNKADEALSDALDLELLNRIRETLRPFVQYPDELRDTDTIQITVTGDQMLSADALLKSLSPP